MKSKKQVNRISFSYAKPDLARFTGVFVEFMHGLICYLLVANRTHACIYIAAYVCESKDN